MEGGLEGAKKSSAGVFRSNSTPCLSFHPFDIDCTMHIPRKKDNNNFENRSGRYGHEDIFLG